MLAQGLALVIFDATVVNMRFVKLLDEDLIASIAGSHAALVTPEEMLSPGAGSAVLEFLRHWAPGAGAHRRHPGSLH